MPARALVACGATWRVSGNQLVSTGLRQDRLDARGPILKSFSDAAAGDLARTPRARARARSARGGSRRGGAGRPSEDPGRGLRTSVRRDARRYRTSPALWPPDRCSPRSRLEAEGGVGLRGLVWDGAPREPGGGHEHALGRVRRVDRPGEVPPVLHVIGTYAALTSLAYYQYSMLV